MTSPVLLQLSALHVLSMAVHRLREKTTFHRQGNEDTCHGRSINKRRYKVVYNRCPGLFFKKPIDASVPASVR